jgi:hypothetical protein
MLSSEFGPAFVGPHLSPGFGWLLHLLPRVCCTDRSRWRGVSIFVVLLNLRGNLFAAALFAGKRRLFGELSDRAAFIAASRMPLRPAITAQQRQVSRSL